MHFNFFKGCILEVLLRPFLNTLLQVIQNESLQVDSHGSGCYIVQYGC